MTAQEFAPLPRRNRSARRQKTAVTLAYHIVEEISRHNYPPGTGLASEKEMLERYDVGCGTLHEALRFLEINGAITIKPGAGDGPTVGQPDSRDLANALSLILQLHSTTSGSIIEVRQAFEPAIAAKAATVADPSMVAAIGRSVDAMEADIDDEDRLLEDNENFHELVARASGKPIFALLISSLWHIIDEHAVGIDYPLKRRRAVVVPHRAIHRALADADADAARLAMTKHMSELGWYVDRYFPHIASGSLRWRDVLG